MKNFIDFVSSLIVQGTPSYPASLFAASKLSYDEKLYPVVCQVHSANLCDQFVKEVGSYPLGWITTVSLRHT